MSNYVYQIHGALENAEAKFKGFRVLVCDLNCFEIVDVPFQVFDNETCKFIQFRLKVTTGALDIQRLPYKVQRAIRVPLGHWLDQWVLENFHGDNRKPKSTNP